MNTKFRQTCPRWFKAIICGIVLIVSLVLSPREFKFQKNLTGTLDRKLGTAAVFFGIAETASLTVSLLPGDAGSEISRQLANVAGFFLVVMGAITLEKLLLTISGFVVLGIIIPIALSLFILYFATDSKILKKCATAGFLSGIIFFAVVPVSLGFSNLIEARFFADELDEQVTGQVTSDVQSIEETQREIEHVDERNWLQKIGDKIKTTVTSAAQVAAGLAKSAVETATGLMQKLVDALIVLVLTNMLLPLGTVIGLGAVLKALLYGLQAPDAGRQK